MKPMNKNARESATAEERRRKPPINLTLDESLVAAVRAAKGHRSVSEWIEDAIEARLIALCIDYKNTQPTTASKSGTESTPRTDQGGIDPHEMSRELSGLTEPANTSRAKPRRRGA